MRPRPAPSAVRTAISVSRDAARTSNRFATFAHAMSSTKPDRANMVCSARRTSPMIWSASGFAAPRNSALLSGNCFERRSATEATSRNRGFRRHARLQSRRSP